jgi:hypothetical protein
MMHEMLDPSPGSDRRAWIIPSFAHPASTAAMMPGFGPSLMRRMKDYRRIAALGVMLHDETEGTVSEDGDGRAVIDYAPSASDRSQLALGAPRAHPLRGGRARGHDPAVPAIVVTPAISSASRASFRRTTRSSPRCTRWAR